MNRIDKTKLHEHFSKYGVIGQLSIYESQYQTQSSSTQHFHFFLVDFVDLDSIKKCFSDGREQKIDGQSVQLRRIISAESILKRKRELAVEEAQRGIFLVLIMIVLKKSF